MIRLGHVSNIRSQDCFGNNSSCTHIVAASVHNSTDTINETIPRHTSIYKLAKLGTIVPSSYVVVLDRFNPVELTCYPLQFLVLGTATNDFWIFACDVSHEKRESTRTRRSMRVYRVIQRRIRRDVLTEINLGVPRRASISISSSSQVIV